MSLVVLTGPVRSGKSTAAERLAASRGKPVVVAVTIAEPDEEMARRIEAHQARRPEGFDAHLVSGEPGWVADVDDGAVLLVECLGTLLGAVVIEEVGDADVATAGQEARVSERAAALVEALAARAGDTIVVTNEVGWGVVPTSAAGRLFRDVVGVATKLLVSRADAAWLVVAGRLVDLKDAPEEASWT